MQLKDFISNALLEICSGIAEAKTQIRNAQIGKGVIAPPYIITQSGAKESTYKIEQINFEVCVTIDNTNNSLTN
ncbi:MAG: hypothetical protein E6Q89_03750 [Bacteroidia bacterium]|nr:MAG: hypothetical protein E6Q89_03750 [Bacteroidia bacterium]